MASDFTIRALNDWRAEVHTDMRKALRVSMEVWNKDGENATKRMLIVMAQSARAQTPQAKKRRKVHRDQLGQYVEILRNGEARKAYRWQFDKGLRHGSWEQALQVPRRGLAKRSWMWGLGKVGGKGRSKPIPNTSIVAQLRHGRNTVGWMKENRLNYIDDIMPSGFERVAEQRAINRVMKQAEMRMVRNFEREVGRI